MSWTDERVVLLKKMWSEGQSASQIARELGGVTRNAVIGKVHRLGMSNRAGMGETNRASESHPTQKPEGAKTKQKVQETKPELKSASLKNVAETSQPARKQIVPAGRSLPQPSASEVRPEALASHREVQKQALRLSLMELTEKTCKWPFGDPATNDFWFCGLPVEPGKPYCKPCNEVAFQPAASRRERRR